MPSSPERLIPIKPKSKRGGKRPGAGRKAGSRNLATTDEIKSIAEAARSHSTTALDTLAHISARGESEAARVSASVHILDRAYGKATEHHELSTKDGKPIQSEVKHSLDEASAALIANLVK